MHDASLFCHHLKSPTSMHEQNAVGVGDVQITYSIVY